MQTRFILAYVVCVCVCVRGFFASLSLSTRERGARRALSTPLARARDRVSMQNVNGLCVYIRIYIICFSFRAALLLLLLVIHKFSLVRFCYKRVSSRYIYLFMRCEIPIWKATKYFFFFFWKRRKINCWQWVKSDELNFRAHTRVVNLRVCDI